MAVQSKVASNEALWVNMIQKLWEQATATNNRKIMSLVGVIGVLFLVKKSNQTKLNSPNFKRDSRKKGKGNVDAEFYKRIKQLLRIVVPKWNDKVIYDLILLTIFLVARTYLSIFISGANGRIVKSIIKLKFPLFLKRIAQLAMISVPASFVNSQLEFLNKRLCITFRQRLTKYLQGLYMKEMIFYQITNLDQRVSNPDQRLTSDIEKWSHSLSQIYSNFTKPTLDIILFSKKLSELVGWLGPMLVIGWYFASGMVIKFVSPPFGKLTAIEQRYEGQYRACHTDLVHHSEEIAFYKGNDWEKERVKNSFSQLQRHSAKINLLRLFMGTFDSMLVKYGAVMVGYGVVGLPVFGPGSEEYLKNVGNDPSAITRDYVRNSSLLINLAKGIGRLVISYKEIQQLAGYTTLVAEMEDVLLQLNDGKYQRQLLGSEVTKYGDYTQGSINTIPMKKELVKISEDVIKFDEIPVVTPSGDTLVQKLSFEVKPGMNVVVTGPNGCGKSSLFRIMGGLWPIFGGKLERPGPGKIFYVAQKPYLPPGNLRDQVIYPHTKLDMLRRKVNDDHIRELLKKVKLEYLEGRDKAGFNAIKEWKDVFSGGEKQRIAMARMFYHKPTFAVLDECTSAVSQDVENTLYKTAKEYNITMFTVSHRHSIFHHYDYILRCDDNSNWTFKKYVEEDEKHKVQIDNLTHDQLYSTASNQQQAKEE